jgi:hypothetical protein
LYISRGKNQTGNAPLSPACSAFNRCVRLPALFETMKADRIYMISQDFLL